jgi:hypothetical protein
MSSQLEKFKIYLKRQNELFEDILKSQKKINKIDKSLHKSIWFSGFWIGILVVQLWALFYGELHYLLTFFLLEIDLMLLMFIFFIKGGMFNGYNK